MAHVHGHHHPEHAQHHKEHHHAAAAGGAATAATPATGAATAAAAPASAPSSAAGAAAAAAAAGVTQISSFPVIDLARWLSKDSKESPSKQADWEADCKTISECLHQYGCLVIRDPRVNHKENDVFIDLMEKYYEQPKVDKMVDTRPDLHYQVGATPDGVENARNHCAVMEKFPVVDKPLTKCPPEADPKWRFFWRMGEKPPVTEFKELNAPQVVPKGFPEWESVMNTWGGLILGSLHTVAEMAAVGFGMSFDTFTKLMKFGPHLLAPTGGDLAHPEYGKLGTVFANFHYDLNFMTIHGKSRFPGLFIWTREGHKMPVKMPEGCLLIQAGKQFEWLTGGHVLAGFHEVVVSPATVEAVAKAKAEKRSCWRVSSTLFSHIASDATLQPLGSFSSAETLSKYPPIKTGAQVQEELNQIKLGKQNSAAVASAAAVDEKAKAAMAAAGAAGAAAVKSAAAADAQKTN